jgi:2'-hydroxyisoflavone reductase
MSRRLLVLGGTDFVGPAVATAALQRGWQVWTFSRGKTGTPVPGTHQVRGDRRNAADLHGVVSRDWDMVVDTWSDEPIVVRESARALAGRTPVYVYLSTESVYAPPLQPGLDEHSRTVDASPTADHGEYPENKRGGELATQEAVGEQATLILRPGAILGPRENTRRLVRWLERAASPGPFLAPGWPGSHVQYIDVRDLADFALTAAVAGTRGAFNVVTPAETTTFTGLVEECVRVTGSVGEPIWVDDRFLLDHAVEPWRDLPLWLPAHLEDALLFTGSPARALAAGLRIRSLTATLTDTWAWMLAGGRHDNRPLPGLTTEREVELLTSWSSGGDPREDARRTQQRRA